MGHYENTKKANDVIERIIKEHKQVSLAVLTVTIRRAFGFGGVFVKKCVRDLEACGIVKVNNTIVELVDNEQKHGEESIISD